MISFNRFNNLIESAWMFILPQNETSNLLYEEKVVNQHSTHVEEMIFTRYKQGLDNAIEGLPYIIKNIGHDVGNYVSKKIDGCVHEDTMVVTKDGPKPICQLTNDDYVKCFDVDTNTFHLCKNTLPRVTGNSKKWVKLV